MPFHLFVEGPTGHHSPAHKLFGDLFGEGAAGALHSLGHQECAVCNEKLGGQDTVLSMMSQGIGSALPDDFWQRFLLKYHFNQWKTSPNQVTQYFAMSVNKMDLLIAPKLSILQVNLGVHELKWDYYIDVIKDGHHTSFFLL